MKPFFNIVKDYYDVLKPEYNDNIIYINTNEDYIKSRIIINKIKNGERRSCITVVIKNRKFDRAYDDLKELSDYVKIGKIELIDLIQSKLGIKLPVYFDNDILNELNIVTELDTLKAQYNKIFTFEENILLLKLGLNNFSEFEDTNKFLSFLLINKERINNILKNHNYSKFLIDAIKKWSRKNSFTEQLLNYISKYNSVDKFIFDIKTSFLLKGYKNFDRNTLGFDCILSENFINEIDTTIILEAIKRDRSYIDIINSALENKYRQVSIFDETVDMEYYLKSISGLIPFEFEFFVEKLKTFIEVYFDLSKIDFLLSIINKAKEKFALIIDSDHDKSENLERLDKFIKKFLELHDLNINFNTINDWFDFYKNKYVELFNSLDNNKNIYHIIKSIRFKNEFEKELIEKIKCIDDRVNKEYEKYLYENFSTFISNNKNITISGKLKEINELLKDDKIVFIVIDAMRWEMWDVVRNIFERYDYSVVNSKDATISMLPSVTNISRKAFFAGNRYSNIIEQKLKGYFSFNINDEYMHIKRYFDDKVVAFKKGGKADFQELMNEDADIYVFIYTDVDELFHGLIDINVDIINSIFESQVANFIREIEERLPFDGYKIVVTTDHGSIDISNQKEIKLKTATKLYFEDKGIKYEQHGKYYRIYCENELLENIYNNLNDYFKKEKFWHVVNRENMLSFGLPIKDLSGNNLMWLIPKYPYYIRSGRGSNVHGGLTMNETIIPFAILEKNISEFRELIFDFESDLKLNTISDIEVFIKNPNNFSIKNIRVISKKIHFSFKIDSLKPYEEIVLNCKIIPEILGQVDVDIFVNYQVKEEEISRKYKESFLIKETSKAKITKKVNKARSLDL